MNDVFIIVYVHLKNVLYNANLVKLVNYSDFSNSILIFCIRVLPLINKVVFSFPNTMSIYGFVYFGGYLASIPIFFISLGANVFRIITVPWWSVPFYAIIFYFHIL